jgi:hypothetical protein
VSATRGSRKRDPPREGDIENVLRSALRRLAVTVPFFTLAGIVLTLFGHPRDAGVPQPVVVIVTSPALHPAFDALENWNDAHGCPARVVTVGVGAEESSWSAGLTAQLPGYRIRGLLLGGDEAQVPGTPGDAVESSPPALGGETVPTVVPVPLTGREPAFRGVPVLRAPVRNLPEAWAFFESCRASGRTLDRILAGEVASAERDHPSAGAADLAAVARPR